MRTQAAKHSIPSVRRANGQKARGAYRFEKTVTINRTPEELYRSWKNLESFSRLDNAEILEEKMNEFISWRTLEGAEVENAGSVRFAPAPGNRGTEVKVTVAYHPPGGKLGEGIAKLRGEDPSEQVKEDLMRWKSLMETGEIRTSRNRREAA